MMYAITWNEEGTRMIQVGIEPVRLLKELKQNEVPAVVSNMPVYKGIRIYVADQETGEIYGATDEEKIGSTLDELGISKTEIQEGEMKKDILTIDGGRAELYVYQIGKLSCFITIEADLERRPRKMIFTIQSIDSEKRKEEKLIRTSNTDSLSAAITEGPMKKTWQHYLWIRSLFIFPWM